MAEALYQNVGALHAANRMLDKAADLTQGSLGSLLHRAQWRMWIFLALARLLRWQLTLIATIVRVQTARAAIDPHMDSCQLIIPLFFSGFDS
jgi:hypothetical protein